MVKLKKGRYRFNFEPCDNFTLSHGSNIYHSRDIAGSNCCDVNIMQDGMYTCSQECTNTFISDCISAGDNITLPKAERGRIRPIKIVYNEELEGTPARIFTTANPAVIELGAKFKTFPIQIKLFILLHEYAHLFYETEWKVDTLALKLFLQMGGNPSQAFYALSKVLKDTPENNERVQRLFNTLKINNYVS
jgi:hypothetical protein